jgi:hypothetical protein
MAASSRSSLCGRTEPIAASLRQMTIAQLNYVFQALFFAARNGLAVPPIDLITNGELSALFLVATVGGP